MKFEILERKRDILSKKHNKNPEDVFEFEFYDMIWHLLDVIHAFETERRKPLREFDYREMLGEVEHVYKTLKGNIRYLEEYRK